MMDTEVIQNTQMPKRPGKTKKKKTKTGYDGTCFKAVMFGKRAVSLCRKTSQ